MNKNAEKYTLQEYAEKYGVKEVINDYNEHRYTREGSIVFPNGRVASIVKYVSKIITYYPDGKESIKIITDSKKHSVAMCDYNGYFDWDILNQYGAIRGRIICNDEDDIIRACEIIRNL